MTYYAISNLTIQLKDNDKKEREKANQLTAADLKDNLHLHYVKMHDHCIYICFFDVHVFSLLFFFLFHALIIYVNIIYDTRRYSTYLS